MNYLPPTRTITMQIGLPDDAGRPVYLNGAFRGRLVEQTGRSVFRRLDAAGRVVGEHVMRGMRLETSAALICSSIEFFLAGWTSAPQH